MPLNGGDNQSVFEKWLASLQVSDPTLYAELASRLEQRIKTPGSVSSPVTGVTLESVSKDPDRRGVALETIVREGRPALMIRDKRIPTDTLADVAAKVIVERLREAAPVVEPLIPLVGRIDLANYPNSLQYAGTGWLVEPNIVVTNRHVAQLIARSESGTFRFRPGRFGEELRVTVDYRHEAGSDAAAVSPVRRVIWIEPDSRKADIAFLEVDRRSDGTTPEKITLADEDAPPNTEVAVIGYPARAPAHIIPDQAWMDQIYGGMYDIKRIAPGLLGTTSRGWSTHDCTTLGGNSGSVVVDMAKGRAVALHFAGLYMIENYAVPASMIRDYLKRRPWQSPGGSTRSPTPKPGSSAAERSKPFQKTAIGRVSTHADQGQVSVTIPLTITVSLGAPLTHGNAGASAGQTRTGQTPDIDEAARTLHREHRVDGIYSIWAGYQIAQGRLSDSVCLVVSAHPDRLDAVRDTMPNPFGGFPVEVRPASIDEQLEAAGITEAPAESVMYNDDDRTGEGFSFAWIDEDMTVRMHVGPERSWVVLEEFLGGAKRELVSSMYEFHAAHIAKAIERELDEGASMTLVLATQSRDPRNGNIARGDFDRSTTFEKWKQKFKFERIFVPLGSAGLVANSYHIKVTVRDGSTVWLSSGNWKRSSQPLIPPANLDDPRKTGAAGNREWHVVIANDKLAERFRNHIKADFEQSLVLGGTPEAVEVQTLIDVPAALLESVELEAAPARVIKPVEICRRVRVKPLLTPDKQGAVYSKAVLKLIRSARKQLLFQNQYIKMNGADRGFPKQLVDALVDKSQNLEDFRIILRSGDVAFDLSQLKRRGMDVENKVRILANTHTKGIIVDGKQVLLGSHNWSSSGVTLNRDASLIFDDAEIAQYYLDAFDLDWDRAQEPRFDETVFESVRPAEGDSPPAGFVRMRLSDYLEG